VGLAEVARGIVMGLVMGYNLLELSHFW